MKNIEIVTPIEVKEYAELTPQEARLVELARQATHRSYAPYSHFSVGAAILLDNNEIITGSNQENAAFSSGTCAERTACFYAGASYPDAKFKAIAVAARDASEDFVMRPVPPCGACRQALLQYETLADDNVKVLLVGRNEIYILPSIKSLLPLSFTEF
ncbi:MAG: cytidine deaminase [Muribaculaceae bacterium]|nr:cytidine deaminase [Muribaculaceae bacterium]